MTKAQVDEQIRIIREATKIASQSKETALQFLVDAGIVKPEKKHSKSKK